MRELELDADHLLFDQNCGIGRVGLALAERGVRIVGVDQAASYVATARRSAERAGLACEYHHGDGREFVPTQACDAAINWFTSLGYAEDDVHSRRILHRAFESLKPGGRFGLDFYNLPGLFRVFETVFESHQRLDGEEIRVVRRAEADFPRGMFRQAWTFHYPDGREVVHRGQTRMYLPHTLAAMLRECGFEDLSFYGGVTGATLDLNSRRCVIFARKPG